MADQERINFRAQMVEEELENDSRAQMVEEELENDSRAQMVEEDLENDSNEEFLGNDSNEEYLGNDSNKEYLGNNSNEEYLGNNASISAGPNKDNKKNRLDRIQDRPTKHITELKYVNSGDRISIWSIGDIRADIYLHHASSLWSSVSVKVLDSIARTDLHSEAKFILKNNLVDLMFIFEGPEDIISWRGSVMTLRHDGRTTLSLLLIKVKRMIESLHNIQPYTKFVYTIPDVCDIMRRNKHTSSWETSSKVGAWLLEQLCQELSSWAESLKYIVILSLRQLIPNYMRKHDRFLASLTNQNIEPPPPIEIYRDGWMPAKYGNVPIWFARYMYDNLNVPRPSKPIPTRKEIDIPRSRTNRKKSRSPFYDSHSRRHENIDSSAHGSHDKSTVDRHIGVPRSTDNVHSRISMSKSHLKRVSSSKRSHSPEMHDRDVHARLTTPRTKNKKGTAKQTRLIGISESRRKAMRLGIIRKRKRARERKRLKDNN